ncbi:MAG: universal stress protein [Nitrospiraceae bacterium]|nr:universal stress protein [Nitrospiraceae bacterium]
MKKILVAHDGSESSEKALKKALAIAETFNSSVTVLSVVPELYLTELMEMDRTRIVATLTEETGRMMEKIKSKPRKIKSLKTLISQGNPAEEILETAKKIKADVIVTGSHGRHGAQKFLLGSVSSKVVDHAECDVLVVKK